MWYTHSSRSSRSSSSSFGGVTCSMFTFDYTINNKVNRSEEN